MSKEKHICKDETAVKILDNLNVGVMYIDKKSNIQFINKAAEDIRKITKEEREGTSVLDCHSPKAHKHVQKVIQHFANGSAETRHKMVKTNGKYFDNSYSIVRDAENNFEGIVLVSQDITEKKHLEDKLKKTNQQLEEKVKARTKEIEEAYNKLKLAQEQLMQSEKMSAIGQFVSGLAHEINNPLDGIQNCIRSVLSDLDDKEQAENYLNLSLEGLFKIEILVRQLLDYAKPHSSEREHIQLNELLDDVLSLTRLRLKDKHIIQRKDFADNLPTIKGDAHYLEQVFVNIILNACDSMDDEGTLKVTTEADDDEVIVYIEDNGCGISEENLKKIYDPFFTTKQQSNGTGLGLYLSYNAIKEHGGIIEVASEVDKGTRFKIRFPAIMEEEKSEKPAEEELSAN
jgi:PAS domain S-box-containing protein